MFGFMRDRVSRNGRQVARGAVLALGLSLALSHGVSAADTAAADPGEIIQAGWKTTEVRYTYTGFTTAFTCDGAESRVKTILLAVGAHPDTKVRAQGCQFNRPTRSFFISIAAAMPVPQAEAGSDAQGEARQALLKRLGVSDERLQDTFPAQWHTLRLDRDRKLDLKPGECELLEGLRAQVFPKLGVEVLTGNLGCMPKQLPIVLPELSVKALLPAASADDAAVN